MKQSVENVIFLDIKRRLQRFQQNRLLTTYADLMEMPEYKKIGNFFFKKLYAPEDFSFRDASIRKLHDVLGGAVYSGMLSAVSSVIALHELTDELDNQMVESMIAKGMVAEITLEQYRDTYRGLDNYDRRIKQIELTIDVTQAFYRLSKKWIVALSLKTVRSAARFMGMGRIIDFIHEGYVAFRQINDIEFFIDTIQEREIAWHEKMWHGH